MKKTSDERIKQVIIETKLPKKSVEKFNKKEFIRKAKAARSTFDEEDLLRLESTSATQ